MHRERHKIHYEHSSNSSLLTFENFIMGSDGGIVLGVPVADPATTMFFPNELNRYKDVQERVFNLQALQVIAKLASSTTAVGHFSSKLEAEQELLRQVAKAEHKEEKLVDKYSNHYGCQAFFLGQRRKQDKVTKHADLLRKHEAQHAACAKRIEALQQSLAEACKERAQWQGKVSELQGLQAEASSLLVTMFLRPPWTSDPTLSPLLAEAASLHSQAASAQQTAGIYRTARAELQAGLGMCHQAVGLLQQAGWLGRFEMGMDFGMAIMDPYYGMERRGGFGELIQMMEIQQAQELVQAAAQHINKARAILPTTPFIQPALVHSAMAGIFADILVGNFFSEMIILRQVNDSMHRVGKMMQEVEQCSNWCAQNQMAFQGQQASLAASAAGKEEKAVDYKKQQVHAALQAQLAQAAVV